MTDLKGQYFIPVRFNKRPFNIKNVTITKSTDAIKRRRPRAKHEAPQSEQNTNYVKYVTSSRKILDYASIAADVSIQASVFPQIKLKNYLDSPGNGLTLVRSKGLMDVYQTKNLDMTDTFREILTFLHSRNHGRYLVNAALAGLVSIFDSILAETVGLILTAKPEVLVKEKKSIPYEDVLSEKTYHLMRQKIIEETIEELLFKPRMQQLAWVERALDIKLIRKTKSWNEFIEVCERRNCYIHNDSKVSQSYIDRVKAATGKAPRGAVGEPITHNKKYFLNAADALFEMAVLITQLVSRKSVEKDQSIVIKEFDKEFNHSIFTQADSGRFDSAARLYDMIKTGLIVPDDLTLRMATINAAVAEKKAGRSNLVEQIINSLDWTASRTEFNLSIAALNGNLEEVCRLIPLMKSSDLVKPSSYFEWPVFDDVRKADKFWLTLKDVYGDELGQIDIKGEGEAQEVTGQTV